MGNDAFEPNDSISAARPVASGRGENAATLTPGTGEDWYRVASTGSRTQTLVGGTQYRFAITSSDVPTIVAVYDAQGALFDPQISEAGCADLPSIDLPAGTFYVGVGTSGGAVGGYAFVAGERTIRGRLFDQGALWAEVLDPFGPITVNVRDQVERVGLVASPAAARADRVQVTTLPDVTTRLLDGARDDPLRRRAATRAGSPARISGIARVRRLPEGTVCPPAPTPPARCAITAQWPAGATTPTGSSATARLTTPGRGRGRQRRGRPLRGGGALLELCPV